MVPEDSFRIQRTDSPFVFAATPTDVSQAGGVTDETAARIAADDAEEAARIAADSAERADRIAADNLEITARTNADNAEQVARSAAFANEANARYAADTAEATARSAGDTAAHFMMLDLSSLPTVDPGGGKVWLKAGDLHVGP
jgi:hypothetical protein